MPVNFRRVSLFCLITFVGTSMLACGGGNSNGSPALSQSDANALATQIASTMADAFGSGGAAAARRSHNADLGPQDSLSCYNSGSIYTCTLSVNSACPAGGSVGLSGSLGGSVDNNGDGSIGVAINESPANCGIDGNIFNGDLSITGNLAIVSWTLSSSQSLSLAGNLSWGANGNQSCAIQLTVNLDLADGSGSANGTICGQQVNATF